jgi:hypothetical protein
MLGWGKIRYYPYPPPETYGDSSASSLLQTMLSIPSREWVDDIYCPKSLRKDNLSDIITDDRFIGWRGSARLLLMPLNQKTFEGHLEARIIRFHQAFYGS